MSFDALTGMFIGLTGRNLHQPILPLIAIKDPVDHLQRRKAWNRGFSTAAVKEYEPTAIKRAGELLDALRTAGREGAVDLAQWISFFACVH